MNLKQKFEPLRRKIETAVAPLVKKITALWTNTKWFENRVRKVWD
jgi:hypothetical protein